VLFLTLRLRKSARKLARTAAMFDAVGLVTLSCLVGVKVELAPWLPVVASSALAFSCLAQRTDDPVELLIGTGVGGERTEVDQPHRRVPPSLKAVGLPSRRA
jgi:hypothetical protein